MSSGAKAVRAVRRNPATTIALVAVAVALVVGARGEDTRNIITRSACAEDPSSKECQKVKRNSDRQLSVRDACIQIRIAGYECPGPTPRREGVSDGGGNNPSGQPGPPSGGPTPTPDPAPAPNRPSVDVDLPLPVEVCVGPLVGVNCP